MGFRIRGSDNILQKLISFVSSSTDKLTDFNVGSAIRTLLESVSLQIEEFYYDLKLAVEFAIKNSGYHAFGFVKKGATKSNGTVTIFFESALRTPLLIPKGTVFYTGGQRRRLYFQSIDNVKIETGAQSAILNIESIEYGENNNVLAGEITKSKLNNPNVLHISNMEDLHGGREKETSIERENRFKEYVHTLQRGTNEALAYGIKQVDGVSGVYIDDDYIGYVKAYVHDKNGNLPPLLKKNVNQALNEWRSAGIAVYILPVIKKEINISLKIVYYNDVNAQLFDYQIANLIKNYINQMTISQNLKISTLITVINDTYRDVIAYIDIEGQKDITTTKNELLRAKTININNSLDIVGE